MMTIQAYSIAAQNTAYSIPHTLEHLAHDPHRECFMCVFLLRCICVWVWVLWRRSRIPQHFFMHSAHSAKNLRFKTLIADAVGAAQKGENDEYAKRTKTTTHFFVSRRKMMMLLAFGAETRRWFDYGWAWVVCLKGPRDSRLFREWCDPTTAIDMAGFDDMERRGVWNAKEEKSYVNNVKSCLSIIC